MKIKPGLAKNQFRCVSCQQMVSTVGGATAHRNHCPYCGYSLHIDENPGDRKSKCNSKMKPLALAFKGGGELCLVHKCLSCGKINYNRIAADDSSEMLQNVFKSSLSLDTSTVHSIQVSGIKILDKEDGDELRKQLYGTN
jgi:DNA-directed RNA polymerase subunit RPC12/RpoP